jgi:hypothetical protein
MSNGKVLQISAEDAKYIDPTQIASLQMVDGTTIIVQGNQAEEGFVEEATDDQQQIQAQTTQDQQQNPQLRGRGALGALAGIAAGTALLGTAAAIGGAMRRPRYGYGMTPMMGPMMGPRMMPPPPRPMGMRGPMMMGPRW